MKWVIVIALLVVLIYLNNASWTRSTTQGELSFLAHRGVHQTYPKENLSRQACTATRIHEPKHTFLENTFESIERAFAYGADVVEIDIHPTADGKFAVFHDREISCRTNGKGDIRGHSLAYLQSLDIGYGYTYDGGDTYPFRGKGVGMMPSLTDVLETFPKQQFLINIKSNSRPEAELIVHFLEKRPNENLARLSFYGGSRPTSRLLSMKPELKGFTKESVKKCVVEYELIGWTGYIPKVCRDTIVVVPQNYAPYIWGWPGLFVSRMESVNTRVILVGRTKLNMGGIDDVDEIKALSKNFNGMIWTDKIERVGSLRE